jgi:CheY-like chemotaxis protein
MSQLRLLILEDEALIAMLLADLAEELGAAVVACVGTIEDALKAAQLGGLDAALLDVNLSDGGSGTLVADYLVSVGVPFAFVTGYGATSRTAKYCAPILRKPFTEQQLQQVLMTLSLPFTVTSASSSLTPLGTV